MKKTTLRKTLIAMLAAAMCATGAVIPTSARDYSTLSCNHTGPHQSHGSHTLSGSDAKYCYTYHYYQCLYLCNLCNNLFMANHSESQEHSPIYKNGPGGLIRVCDLCGYQF